MKNYFTSGFEKYRHKHCYILAVTLALTISMFWSVKYLGLIGAVLTAANKHSHPTRH